MALESLNALSEDKFGKLIEGVISFISGDSDSEKLKETISILCEQDSELSENSIIRAVSSLVLFFREGIKTHMSVSNIRDELSGSGLQESFATLTANKWKQKYVVLSRGVMGQTLTVNQLLDMEWKFGVTASNNDVSKAGTSFLQLKFVLDKGNNETETALMELSLSQFYEFMAELQKAKANLDYFNV